MSYIPNNHLRSVAIYCHDSKDYSLSCMSQILLKLGYSVDILSVSDASADDINSYAYTIYIYDDGFSEISALFDDYSGMLLIIYERTSPNLSSLRAYQHAHSLVRHQETQRQYLATWMQTNAERIFCLARSELSAADLVRWGVKKTAASPAILPAFIPLNYGIHASEHIYSADSITLLVYGDFAPDTGHKLVLYLIAAYRSLFKQSVRVYFSGRYFSEFCVYKEEVLLLAKLLKLSDSIEFEFIDSLAECRTFHQADIFLQVDSFLQPTDALHTAQAMGMPSFIINSSELPKPSSLLPLSLVPFQAVAHAVHDAVFCDIKRLQGIIEGYRFIAESRSFEVVEALLLSHILSAFYKKTPS